jgi:acyl-coenzyme A synthetase/AMP-(fatty) acid ligase
MDGEPSTALICSAFHTSSSGLQTQTVAWRRGVPVSASQFLAEAWSLAERLSSDQAVINTCQDRYGFAVVWAAALWRGVVSWMPPNLLAETLDSLQAAHQPQTFQLVNDAALLSVPHELQEGGETAVHAWPQPGSPLIPHAQAAVCLLTSGSTGAAQPHQRSWGELVDNIRAASTRLAAQLNLSSAPGAALLAGLNIVATVPPQHSYGLESSVLLAWLAGAAFESEAVFFPADIAKALQRLPRPRALVTTPFHLKNLLMSGVELPPIDGVLCATAPLSQALALEAEARLGGPLVEIYGCTETGQLATRRTVHELIWHTLGDVSLQRTEHEGQARYTAQGGHVRQTTLLADNLLLHSPQQFEWITRANDLVHVAGKRSSLAHLNHHLNRIDGVRDGAFWLPDEVADTVVRPIAFVVAPGLEATHIIEALRHKLDPVFVPRKVVHVDALPREATGKLPLAVLKRFALNHLNQVASNNMPDEPCSIEVACPISTRHPSLQGHFPGQPVLPGVVLLSAVWQALQTHHRLQQAIGERPVLLAAKFLSMVSPDAHPTEAVLNLKVHFAISTKGVTFEMHEGTRLVLRGLFALATPSNEGGP